MAFFFFFYLLKFTFYKLDFISFINFEYSFFNNILFLLETELSEIILFVKYSVQFLILSSSNIFLNFLYLNKYIKNSIAFSLPLTSKYENS